MTYPSMPAVVSKSVERTKNKVYSENTVAVKNMTTTSHVDQERFWKTPYAAMRLVIPIKPMWGGKPLIASRTRKIIPTTP